MKTMKKTALPSALVTALLMTVSVGAAQAAAIDYGFNVSHVNDVTGFTTIIIPADNPYYNPADPTATMSVLSSGFVNGFIMFDGYDPSFTMTPSVVDNGNVFGDFSGYGGDPINGSMTIDWGAGTGTAIINAGAQFFGSDWSAHNITLSGITGDAINGGTVTANMLFDWGAPQPTPCGVTNCDIGVTLDWAITALGGGLFSFTTTTSSMPAGPFAGFQPTFNGSMSVVPVPATAWMVGSGLLGLLGVGRARRKTQLAV